MNDELVVHNLDNEQPPEPSDPVVFEEGCKIHNDIKDPEEVVRKQEPRKILRPWYEMIDKAPL